MPRENGSLISVRDTISIEEDPHVAHPSTLTFRVDFIVYHPVDTHIYIVEIEETPVVVVYIASLVVRRVHFVLRDSNRHVSLEGFREGDQVKLAVDGVSAVHTHRAADCVYFSVIG